MIETGDIDMLHQPPPRATRAAETRGLPVVAALPTLPTAIADIDARRLRGELDDAQFTALYFLHWQIALHGRAFASRQRKRDVRPDASEWLAVMGAATGGALRAWLLDCFERSQFRGVSAQVPIALHRWLSARWPLVLRGDVLSPLEILRAQARGRRAVTAITAFPRLREPVLGKPNAFVFLQHDLEHAYKFFHSAALHDGQCAFFRALEAAIDRDLFTPYVDDPIFAPKLHYLMSDMNTHPRHSRQYLRAILIEHHLRRAGKALTAALDPSTRQSIERIMRAVATPVALTAGA